MLPIVWSADAEEDIFTILTYITERNPLAANNFWYLVNESIETLSTYPNLYRKSERVAGTRELVVTPNYVVSYQVFETEILILRVLHARQKFP